MFIQEAVKEAIKKGREIYRKSARNETLNVYATIKPTNTYETCLLTVHSESNEKSCRSWNPTADDLMADDWKVTTE